MTDRQRRFFKTVGPRLEAFAKRHNLQVVRWLKDCTMWSLEFQHPCGGGARIDVEPHYSKARVSSSWHRDNYDKEYRQVAFGVKRPVETSEPELEQALLQELRDVASWPEEALGERTRFPGLWHNTWDKKTFDAFDGDLPKPKLEGGGS